VVLYRPSQKDLLSKIELLEQAVDHIILVDNTEAGTLWLSENYPEAEKTLNVTYFQPMKNLGIAAAQNMALEYAFSHFDDDDKVIFFDQDSSISIDLPHCLAQAYDRLSINHSIAAVGPSFVDEKKGFIYPQVSWNKFGSFQRFIPNTELSEQKTAALISSGMLTSIYTFKQVGLYDDVLFIDYVDTDWCLKAQAKGFELYVIPSISMMHSIGAKSIKVFGRYFTVHSPLRRYYMIRNSFFMAKKEYVKPTLALTFICRTSLHHLLLILLDCHKKEHLRALLKGLLDGYLNKIENHQLLSKCLKIKQK